MMSESNQLEMPPKKRNRGNNELEYGDEVYRKRRDRNNEAVKKSRFKSKQRIQETFRQVSKLKDENQMLEEKVKTLTKELQFLKELFLAHASNVQSPKICNINLNKFLENNLVEPKDKKTDSN